MATQTLIIRVDEGLSRWVRAFLVKAHHGYSSLDEFVEVALTNQLSVEAADLRHIQERPDRGERRKERERRAPLAEDGTANNDPNPVGAAEVGGIDSVLRRPPPTPQLKLAQDPQLSSQALFVFTNRLSPIKVAVRVLANLASEGEWPEPGRFRDTAAVTARNLGLRLRAAERRDQTLPQRRWVAYPGWCR